MVASSMNNLIFMVEEVLTTIKGTVKINGCKKHTAVAFYVGRDGEIACGDRLGGGYSTQKASPFGLPAFFISIPRPNKFGSV
jgi:hypothetical protein